MGKIRKALNGQRFGKLIVVKYIYSDNHGETYWLCKCDCGNEIIVKRTNLRSGNTKSCGCLHSDVLAKRNETHGLSKTRQFSIWQSMIQRCYNPNTKFYERYGGRGITIYDEWKNDFKAFYDWSLQNGYQDNLTIDRIDNNKGYEPTNCRWSTQKEQCENRSTTRLFEVNGQVYSANELSKISGISARLIKQRVDRDGWTIEKAISIKPNKKEVV